MPFARAPGSRSGGAPDNEADRCYPPTVLTGVTHQMRLMCQEVFGPVLPIMPVKDMIEAVALANDSRLGLAASVWTADRRLAEQIAGQLKVGGVVINDCLIHFAIPGLPFGGVGESGSGRTHGREGLWEYCATQAVVRHRFGPRREWQWFPAGSKHRLMARLARLLFRSGLLARFRSPAPPTGRRGMRVRQHPFERTRRHGDAETRGQAKNGQRVHRSGHYGVEQMALTDKKRRMQTVEPPAAWRIGSSEKTLVAQWEE